jgi:growth hormone-inducible transmembrane protein
LFPNSPDKAIKPVRIAVASGSVLGIGSLCYYGLHLGKKTSHSNAGNSKLWSDEVKQKVFNTYWYLGATVAICATSAVVIFNVPFLLNLVTKSGLKPIIATIVFVGFI